MFNASFKKSILSTVAAAVVVTGISLTPAMAGEGGGGGREEAKWNYASSTENGVTTTAYGRNGNGPEVVVKKKNGFITGLRRALNRNTPFVSTVDPDGTKRIIVGAPQRTNVSYVTRHNPDGTTTTIAGTPVRDNVPSISMTNEDGSVTTIRGNR
ncbi:MAG: hypothetical protein AAF382_04900 [Pseudomonadota bacterium]